MRKKIRLGDYCKISAGGDKPSVFSLVKKDNCNVPVYANGIDNEGLVGYTNKATICKKSVTVAARGSCGFAFYRDVPYVPIIRLITLTPIDENSLDARYLYYLLKLYPFRGIGSVQAQITVPQISDYCLEIEDDIVQQRKIANCLSKIDEKICVNNEEIALLHQIADDYFVRWFLQFDFPSKELKSYKTLGGNMVYNETLKTTIPEKWSVINIKNICKLIWGQCPEGKNILPISTAGSNLLPYCSGAGDMRKGIVVDCQAKTDASRREAFDGDILMSVAGSIGALCICDRHISLGRAAVAFRPQNDNLAFCYFMIKKYISRMMTVSSGSIQKVINDSNIDDINFAYDEKTVKQFSFANSIIRKCMILSSECTELERMRDELMPLLINGQVYVKE